MDVIDCRDCGDLKRRNRRCARCAKISYWADPRTRRTMQDRARWQKFRLRPEQYEAMLEAQHRVCAICRQPETMKRNGRVISLAVDHDHRCCDSDRTCGECIRGLLCNRCNRAVHHLEQMSPLMDDMLGYLATHGGR